MPEGELLDAREAMSVLGINENELQTLVARGDLRAFRSAGTMKFRRDDVGALKSEKGTEPTIIIPAAGPGARKGASGILPVVQAPGSRPPSRVGPAVARPPSRIQPAILAPVPSGVVAHAPSESATSDIVLDDIELVPTDDQHITQQVTVAQSAVGADIGGATVVDSGAAPTGEMTVMESAPTAITASGRRVAIAGTGPVVAAPATSRVRPAVSAGVSMATSKRTQAVYQAKTAGPVWTVFAILNTIVLLLAGSICAVMISRGSFDGDRIVGGVEVRGSHQRIIPPFLGPNSQFKIYEWCYDATPGNPADADRPSGEYAGK